MAFIRQTTDAVEVEKVAIVGLSATCSYALHSRGVSSVSACLNGSGRLRCRLEASVGAGDQRVIQWRDTRRDGELERLVRAIRVCSVRRPAAVANKRTAAVNFRVGAFDDGYGGQGRVRRRDRAREVLGESALPAERHTFKAHAPRDVKVVVRVEHMNRRQRIAREHE